MKKIISIGLLCLSFSLGAQTLSYGDMGVLLTNENINGTARFNALSGAFGALGGDLSAVDINPAGAAVFRNSEFSASLNFRDNAITSNYYGTSIQNDYDFNNFGQAGAVFVFNTHQNSEWKKVVLGFNYSRTNDFEGSWIARGNSGLATWTGHEDDNNTTNPYIETTGQAFGNFTNGENKRYTFSIASQYNDNLYFGASINSYDVNYYQQTILEENNHDGFGNNLDASFIQELSTYGDGISFSVGMIAKPNKNIRLGLSYQSPIWYSLIEDSIEEDSELVYSTGTTLPYYSGINSFSYDVRTPSKLTGSMAYIFNEHGLISIDYSYKNYSNIHFKRNDFYTENNNIKNDLNSTSGIKIGTEWRIDRLSLRGGYHTAQNPYKTAISSDDISGFSLGAGLNFKGFKFDLAYQKDNYTSAYNFYPSDDYNVSPAELDIDTSKITATLTLKL